MKIGENYLFNRQRLREDLLRQRQELAIAQGQGGEAVVTTDERGLGVKGKVKIEAIYPDKTEVLVDDDPNLVVRQAEDIMPYMTIGQRPITYIELGDPSPATPPAEGDTSLEQTTGEQKSVTSSIAGNSVSFEATWLTTEGNGFSFTEAGLFTSPLGTGLLFARKTFSAITKSAAFALKFTWGLVFNVGAQNPGCTGISLLGSSTITHDYEYPAVGGESQLVVPIDFTIGSKQLDVFLNGQRLHYSTHYYESTIGAAKGIIFVGFTLNLGDIIYIVNRKLA